MNGKGFDVYKNPDSRCTYPWSDCFCGYCWSYASHVDGNPKFADMKSICVGCDMYAPQESSEAGQQPATSPGTPPTTAASVG